MSRAIPKLAANIRANLRTPLPQAVHRARERGFRRVRQILPQRNAADFRAARGRNSSVNSTEATAAAAGAMDELTAWLESPARHRHGRVRARRRRNSAQMLRTTERVDMPLEELELSGARISSATLPRSTRPAPPTRPRQSLAACVGKDARQQAGGRHRRGRTPAARRTAPVRDRQEAGHASRARSRRWWPNRRRTIAAISPTSAFPGPYENPAVKVTYYVAPPDAKWSAAERNAYLPGRAYLLYVSVHEVWPGHYLQSQFANAQPVAHCRAVVGLLVRRGLGALHRGDDV